jgi:Protein of unknown function (DUF4019)
MSKQVFAALFLALTTCSLGSYAQPASDKAAAKAAEQWLTLIDNGQYRKSWDDAATSFKSRVKKAQWEAQLKAARNPMGKFIHRNLVAEKAATSLPGAPDGEYVVLQYDASFDKKKAAVETVTPVKEKDGTWRVTGYFIK